jgi:DNA segregation ATPase FtsK/SpoIIIE-like protein
MRMARKKKRADVTYDSKEIRTLLGLLAFLLGIVFFIASFVEMGRQDNVLTWLRLQLGITTVAYAFFCFSMGLKMFRSKLPVTNTLSIFSQAVLLVLLPALLGSLYRLESAARRAADTGFAGGRLGYWFAYDIFADTLVFGQFTPIILGTATLIFLPLALSMSISKFIDLVIKVVKWLIVGFKSLTSVAGKAGAEIGAAVASEKSVVKTGVNGDLNTAKRFGDFQRKQEAPKLAEPDRRPDAETASHQHQATIEEIAAAAHVGIREKVIGEEGLSQSELAYPDWKLPPVTLLEPFERVKSQDADTGRNAEIIERTLASFGIDAEVAEAFVGPSVVRYALSIPLGTKVSKIEGLSATLALGLGVDSKAVRVDTIPGTTYLGIEVPRQKRDYVKLRELMEAQKKDYATLNLPIVIGKDIDGDCIVADLQKMPHLLIAGATGSGKSILTNSFILTMLMNRTPDELRMILVDPKQVELMDYNGIPHLLTPVITDMSKVVNALKWAVDEMERRYTVMAHDQVRNIEEFNKKAGFAAMPYIVVVIDEMADMMMTANRVDAENAIVRLTQKARAVGIHLILATQRPSVNVITGLIKANVPSRIGMSVASNTDSRVIMDASGAESLMGKGDLLYNSPGVAKMERLQGPFVKSEEITRVVDFIKSQVPEVEYMTSILDDHSVDVSNMSGGGAGLSDDDQFAEAVRVIVNSQKGSASFLQRKLSVGFNRAARLLEEMEEMGIVGPQMGSKPREVLISNADEFLQQMRAEQAG